MFLCSFLRLPVWVQCPFNNLYMPKCIHSGQWFKVRIPNVVVVLCKPSARNQTDTFSFLNLRLEKKETETWKKSSQFFPGAEMTWKVSYIVDLTDSQPRAQSEGRAVGQAPCLQGPGGPLSCFDVVLIRISDDNSVCVCVCDHRRSLTHLLHQNVPGIVFEMQQHHLLAVLSVCVFVCVSWSCIFSKLTKQGRKKTPKKNYEHYEVKQQWKASILETFGFAAFCYGSTLRSGASCLI